MNKTAAVETLTRVCNLPTAPYCERYVIGFLVAWARQRREHVGLKRDRAGNVYLQYRRGGWAGGVKLPPLVIEAHMDHPGFVVTGREADGRVRAEFRGGVRPSHFAGAAARFWAEAAGKRAKGAGNGDGAAEVSGVEGGNVDWRSENARAAKVGLEPRGEWVTLNVLEVRAAEQEPKNFQHVLLEAPPAGAELPVGTLGMWNLPDATVTEGLFAARVCDDLAGVAAGLCLIDELIAQGIEGEVTVMASRAEEVGFAGVLAALENGWVKKNARVVGLETSKASAGGATQGGGPIVRVGDKQGIFSPGLTHFICQAAGAIGDEDAGFAFQRRLMDAGTCNSTAFTAYGYDAAGITLPLGNYHNMAIEGDAGWGDGAKAGPGIASETIRVDDFVGLVRVLVEVVKRYPAYKPKFGVMRERLGKLYADEQRELLERTSDRAKGAGTGEKASANDSAAAT